MPRGLALAEAVDLVQRLPSDVERVADVGVIRPGQPCLEGPGIASLERCVSTRRTARVAATETTGLDELRPRRSALLSCSPSHPKQVSDQSTLRAQVHGGV